MLSQLRKIGIYVATAFIVIFILFAANQLLSLYANLQTINTTIAIIVTSLAGILLMSIIVAPVVLYLKLPSSISDETNPAVYRKKLLSRLSRNKRVKSAGLDVYEQEGMDKALNMLNEDTQKVINDTATAVFLTTAISQNGKLDALTVLITQTRMVWKIAHIYWQRPTLKDMMKLYGNVAAAGLIASEIEEIDISRQIEPIINALLKSPGRSLPVVGHAAHIITDSLLEGSTNAFLTLRVGIITQRYCGALSPDIDRKVLRKNTFMEASVMLRSLVIKSSGKVISSVLKAMKDAGKNTVKSGLDSIGKAAKNVKVSVGEWISGK